MVCSTSIVKIKDLDNLERYKRCQFVVIYLHNYGNNYGNKRTMYIYSVSEYKKVSVYQKNLN